MEDPGRHLQLHRAPEGLLDRAMSRVDRDQSRWPLAVAAAAMLIVGATGGWLARDAIQPAPVLAEAPPSLLVNASEQPVPVRLVIHMPDAQSVAVAGTFNGWSADAAPLERAEDGTWHATVRLERGRYEYMFVIDGVRWVGDPTAPLSTPDDFGQANAVLDV